MADSSAPYLFPDLERLIFELAASKNGAKASTPLLLVAKRVREWIRPVIFRVINQLGPDSPGFTLLPELLHSVGPLVQHLTCVTYHSINGPSVDISRKITLSSFPNVRDLTIHIPLHLAWGELDCLLPTLQKMPHITRLTVPFLCESYTSLLLHPFLNITHLGIIFSNGPSWEGQWEILTRLPKRTHINANSFIRPDLISKLLLYCPLLTVFTEFYQDAYKDKLFRVDDIRLALITQSAFAHYRSMDWENGANGGVDVWIFAELVVLARRRGYFWTSLPKTITRSAFKWENYLNDDGQKWSSELKSNDS